MVVFLVCRFPSFARRVHFPLSRYRKDALLTHANCFRQPRFSPSIAATRKVSFRSLDYGNVNLAGQCSLRRNAHVRYNVCVWFSDRLRLFRSFAPRISALFRLITTASHAHFAATEIGMVTNSCDHFVNCEAARLTRGPRTGPGNVRRFHRRFGRSGLLRWFGHRYGPLFLPQMQFGTFFNLVLIGVKLLCGNRSLLGETLIEFVTCSAKTDCLLLNLLRGHLFLPSPAIVRIGVS